MRAEKRSQRQPAAVEEAGTDADDGGGGDGTESLHRARTLPDTAA